MVATFENVVDRAHLVLVPAMPAPCSLVDRGLDEHERVGHAEVPRSAEQQYRGQKERDDDLEQRYPASLITDRWPPLTLALASATNRPPWITPRGVAADPGGDGGDRLDEVGNAGRDCASGHRCELPIKRILHEEDVSGGLADRVMTDRLRQALSLSLTTRL